MIFKEIHGDLFSASKEFSFAHCISKDKALGAGIAKIFRMQFPDMIKKMESDTFIVGKAYGYTVLDNKINGKRNILNLVTKDRYFQKPSYASLEKSLYSLRDLIVSHHIKNLAIPKLGCGLDRLNWERVASIIRKIFCDLDINIFVYYL
jgi:O-acetyl-ADP-ribose deacetylase (regulator of RNase III)